MDAGLVFAWLKKSPTSLKNENTAISWLSLKENDPPLYCLQETA